MKKSILIASLISALTIMTVGCGGDDTDNKVTAKDVTLDFKTSGTYDLSEYISPSQSQDNRYVQNTYTNSEGKRNYAVDPVEVFNKYSYEVNGSTISEYDGFENETTTFTILTDKISEILTENSALNMEVVRYAEIGDYISKIITTYQNNGIDIDMEYLCKIDAHLDLKEVNGVEYNDVLESTCTGEMDSNSSMFTITSSDASKMYHAKGIGLIQEIEETCSTTTVGKNITNECEKITLEILPN